MRSYIVLGISSVVLFVGCQRKCCDEVPVVNATYVHRYGVAVPGDFWEASGQHGQVMSTMADGVVITRTYCAGLLDGDTTYSYPHSSQIEKRETYVQGSLVKEVQYFFDGTPKQETVFDSPLGFSTVTTWYLNGTPKSTEQMNGQMIVNGDYYTINNQRDATVENRNGTRLIRDDYGQLQSTDTISGGELSLRTTYFPNGSPRESTCYANGVMHGEKRVYYPAGEPNCVETWCNGCQHGTTVLYQHGEKYAEVPYVNGQKHGTEVRYRDGCDVVQEISWEQNRLHGPSTTYVGETATTEWYYCGAPTNEGDYYLMKNRSYGR
jgi:antitoxin component YwqK of YwqJK toxin-antitoxin module